MKILRLNIPLFCLCAYLCIFTNDGFVEASGTHMYETKKKIWESIGKITIMRQLWIRNARDPFNFLSSTNLNFSNHFLIQLHFYFIQNNYLFDSYSLISQSIAIWMFRNEWIFDKHLKQTHAHKCCRGKNKICSHSKCYHIYKIFDKLMPKKRYFSISTTICLFLNAKNTNFFCKSLLSIWKEKKNN